MCKFFKKSFSRSGFSLFFIKKIFFKKSTVDGNEVYVEKGDQGTFADFRHSSVAWYDIVRSGVWSIFFLSIHSIPHIV